MFDLEKFKSGKYFVHLPTHELYDKAMKFLEENGISWTCVEATNKQIWEKYKEETAINFEEYIYYADKHYYEVGGFKELPINNMVKSPNHYIGDQGLEVEEVLRNFIPRYEDSYVAHRVASALEYLLRAPLKNGKQDLEKARYNITQALEYLDSKEDSFE